MIFQNVCTCALVVYHDKMCIVFPLYFVLMIFFVFYSLSLLDICSIPGRLDLHKLLIASLDCAHDNHSRVVLSKLLTSKEKVTI